MRGPLTIVAAFFILFLSNVAQAAECGGRYYYCSKIKGCCLKGETCQATGCRGGDRGGVACGGGTCSPGHYCGTKDGRPYCYLSR